MVELFHCGSIEKAADDFSKTNLRYIIRFYGIFKDIQIVPQLGEQFGMVSNKVFMIPWGHIKLLIDKYHDKPQKFKLRHRNTTFA